MLGFYEPSDKHAEFSVRASFARLADWVSALDPELVVVFGPDHYNGFFYELMPPFCLGIRAEASSDWDIQPGPLQVPEALAVACLEHVRAADVDLAASWKMTVDHGTTIPLNYLAGALDRYPVLPIVVNCVAPPLPSFRRCRALGQAVGSFLAKTGKRVLILGSGGLSHDPPTPRLAELPPGDAHLLIERRRPTRNEYDQRQARVVRMTQAMLVGQGPCLPPDPDWDLAVLDHLRDKDLAWFDGLQDKEVWRLGGHGGGEVRCWVAAAAAMAACGDYQPTVECYQTIPEWLTGMGLMRFESIRGEAS